MEYITFILLRHVNIGIINYMSLTDSLKRNYSYFTFLTFRHMTCVLFKKQLLI